MKPIVLLVTAPVLFLLACQPSAENQSNDLTSAPKDSTAAVAHGQYLVNTIGCNDCHTPKTFGPNGMQLDQNLLLSGHQSGAALPAYDTVTSKSWILMYQHFTAFVGPWGTSFAGNLTPDPSGIGSWSEEQFRKALREGKFKGMDNTRPLLPPMPWENFAQLTDADIHDMFMYLKSIKPVYNVVPNPIPPVGTAQ